MRFNLMNQSNRRTTADPPIHFDRHVNDLKTVRNFKNDRGRSSMEIERNQ